MNPPTRREDVAAPVSLSGHNQPLTGMTTMDDQVVVTRDRQWRDRAACRDTDPEAFFPVAETGPEHEAQVAVAKAICAGCPVRAECFAWALKGLAYGIAGGMTEDERRRHRAVRHRSPRPARAPDGRRGGTPPEVVAAGQDAIRRGWSPRAVACAFGVAERTAQRWAARVRLPQQQTHEGIRG